MWDLASLSQNFGKFPRIFPIGSMCIRVNHRILGRGLEPKCVVVRPTLHSPRNTSQEVEKYFPACVTKHITVRKRMETLSAPAAQIPVRCVLALVPRP